MESDILRAICQYLALRKVFFFRCNNIPASYIAKEGQRQFRRLSNHTRKGISDIVAVKDGRAIFIEVKTDKGRQSPEQLDFGSDAVLAGATYIVARSIDDVQKAGL